MARKTTAKVAETKVAETKASTKAEPKYGVNDLIEVTGLQAASIRVGLRGLGVEKNFGNQYGWDTKRDFDEIVKGLKERSAKRVVPAKAKEPEPVAAKPARKPRAKKAPAA